MELDLMEQLPITPHIQPPLPPTTLAIRSRRFDNMPALKVAGLFWTPLRPMTVMDVSQASTFQSKTRAQQRFTPTTLTTQSILVQTRAASSQLIVTTTVICSPGFPTALRQELLQQPLRPLAMTHQEIALR